MLGWYYRQYVFRFNPNYMKCKQAAHWFSLSGKFPLATSACNSMHFSIFLYKVKIDGKTCCWCYCKNSTNDDSRSNTGRWVSECHQFIYVRGFRIKLQFVDFAAAGEPNKKKTKIFVCCTHVFVEYVCAIGVRRCETRRTPYNLSPCIISANFAGLKTQTLIRCCREYAQKTSRL